MNLSSLCYAIKKELIEVNGVMQLKGKHRNQNKLPKNNKYVNTVI